MTSGPRSRPPLAAVLARHPGAETFTFGDGPAMSDELLGLVRAERKTATCAPLRDYAPDGDEMASPGRRDVALEWDGRPALVIETLSVHLCPFDEVDEDFALAEGETDDLQGWRDGHRAYFERNGGFDPKMILVCERFRVVEDFGEGGG